LEFDITILKPDIGLEGEVMKYGEKKEYKLHPLSPNAFYEVRISYPAIIKE